MDTGLIHRVLTNNATERERKELTDWIEASSENKEEFHNIRLLWSHENSYIEQEKNWGGFSKIKDQIEHEIRKQKRVRVIRAIVLFTALILFSLVPIGIFHLNNKVAHGYLHFENASVETVVKAIESEYDVTIQIEEPDLLACKFTGTLYHVQFTNNVLQDFSSALNISFEDLSNRKFKLKGLGCRALRAADQK
jgi:ferric-dicitrate binding protein FerR (iron transport regulator)